MVMIMVAAPTRAIAQIQEPINGCKHQRRIARSLDVHHHHTELLIMAVLNLVLCHLVQCH